MSPRPINLDALHPDDRAEVLRLATKGARKRCKGSRKPDRPAKAPRRTPAVRVPSEHEEQAALIQRCDEWAQAYPELGMLYAIPNEMGIGGRGGRIIGARRKAAGRKPGVPDLCLPVPRGTHAGMYLELKRVKGGRLSPEQIDWHTRLTAHGYHVVVARGCEEAWQEITRYLGITNPPGHPADHPAATAA